jgi:hypothetical protein
MLPELIDNKNKTLKDDLAVTITRGSKVSIAAACFSIYAFRELKTQLSAVSELRFIIACFDDNVTEETVKAIAQQKPYCAVFRDSSYASGSVAANFEQIFRAYSHDTVRRVL